MRRKLFSLGCCAMVLLMAIFTSCKTEVNTSEVKLDKIAPNSVSNFSGSYNATSKKITLSWKEPEDEDYKEVRIYDGITCYTFAKNITSHVFNNIEADDKVYNFTAITYDNVGNAGVKVECSVKALNIPAVTAVELSRNHIAYNDKELTIDVIVKGSNFDLIGLQNDKTLKVGIWDSTDVMQGIVTDTVLNISNNTARATIAVPKLTEEYATVEGIKYNVKVIICGTFSEVVAPFIISREAWLTSVPTLSLTQLPSNSASGKTTTMTLKGVNFDVGVPVTIQLYNNYNKPQGDAVPVTITGNKEQIVTAEIPLPAAEGVFTAKVLFNGVPQDKYWGYKDWRNEWTADNINHPTVQIYGLPTFTSFSIPNAGTKKQFANICATVKGRNFTAPGITLNNFTLKCTESSIINNYKIEVIDDTTLKITLKIPANAKNYTVNIACGNNNCDGTFVVKDYTGYNVGDVLLNDGTKIAISEINENNKANVVAIIYSFTPYGTFLGVGLEDCSLSWAKKESTGYNTKFTDIMCTSSQFGVGAALTATFEGDLDGSDNWDVICGVDVTGTANDVIADNYPIFNYAEHYGDTLTENYKTGWYIPSIAELCELYKNKDAIEAALTAIGKTILRGYYWSSSQNSYNNTAWGLRFPSGEIYDKGKDGNENCLCIRAL